MKDFGATGDGVHDDLASFQRAFDFLDTIGGGILQLPQGKYRITGQLNIGNGSDEAQSSKHHGIRIVGQSAGVGPDVSSVHRDGATTILYDGPVDTQSAVISFEGPIHNVGVEHVHL